ncbi:CLUMA_CG002003, isoform A [Clunio marinus]|uniref:CLUMA_CG002003, isoform A n=1 Tax=Clunio marinus TaxID=568069 RepID=A0A1J1HP18_9DIPT|nr:CLUMA_CG002003, isoform A [Clunio marinus]
MENKKNFFYVIFKNHRSAVRRVFLLGIFMRNGVEDETPITPNYDKNSPKLLCRNDFGRCKTVGTH